MPFLDIAIVVVVVVSVLVGLIRGFTRELMSIIAWVVAIYLAINFHEPVGVYLQQYINNPWISNIAAMALVFVGALFLLSMVGFLISKAVAATGVKGTDRVLGSVLGLVRGVLIIGCAIVIASIFNVQNTGWWKESKLVDQFVPVANAINDILPEKFRNKESMNTNANIGSQEDDKALLTETIKQALPSN